MGGGPTHERIQLRRRGVLGLWVASLCSSAVATAERAVQSYQAAWICHWREYRQERYMCRPGTEWVIFVCILKRASCSGTTKLYVTVSEKRGNFDQNQKFWYQIVAHIIGI